MKKYTLTSVKLARTFRKNMTVWERKLWYDFLRDYPIHFYRQRAIGKYIVDFYCSKARLVVELDGSGHSRADQKIHDSERTGYLESLGIQVLRIKNESIDRHFALVCESIDALVQEKIACNLEDN